MRHCRQLVKLFLFSAVVCGVLTSPTAKDDIETIFKETKRDIPSVGSSGASAVLKSSLYNPYLYPPPFFPGKPLFYPLLTPPGLLLNRFGKASDAKATSTPATANPLIGSYFKAKKNEFLEKLLENLSNASEPSEIYARSATPPAPPDADGSSKPATDPSLFLNKKLEFLEKLFKTLNATATATAAPPPEDEDEATTAVVKPTIVPANFWFPFLKPPKPPKAPKPTKPPKAKKVLKDAIDTIILQSLLTELGMDPANGSPAKRAVVPSKKAKSKKPAADEAAELRIPVKIDPTVYSAKASDCLDKLFKILSKADAEDLSTFIEPKATVIPNNLWTQPSETEYTSKLDAFLDLLVKSLNATENLPEPTQKPTKSKKVKPQSKILTKRSTFLDELLHRIPPSPTPAAAAAATVTSTSGPDLDSSKCSCSESPCCCSTKCSEIEDGSDIKPTRSLIFKPFGTGYWIPQYLYAAKMGLYLDKLIDTINTAAAEDLSPDSAPSKRSVTPDEKKINITGMDGRQAAVTLLISELTDIKNDLVEAFGDGIKAQKSASTAKPFASGSKSFKKPFWGGKTPPTVDPVEPIQKRIDILNDVFDKIAEVEKIILFPSDKNDSNVFSSLDGTLRSTPGVASPKLGLSKYGKAKGTDAADAAPPEGPDYYIEKTRDFLQSLYANKLNALDDDDE